MRVLFIGLGSIGRTHLNACRAVHPQGRYAAWRRPRAGRIDDRSPVDGVEVLVTDDAVREFAPELAFVCTPTDTHLQVVEALVPLRPVLFVEKPLAHQPEDASAIAAAITAADVPFFYGCVMRHHPLTTRVTELIQRGQLGRPVCYRLHCGSYLPGWRPGRDYRTTYSAARARGGGASLDLVHEFDIAEAWFGPMSSLHGVRAHVSDLELAPNTDDVCMATAVHAGVIGQITVDYLRRRAARGFEVVFDGGALEGDYLTGRLTWSQDGTSGDTVEHHAITRDELYARQAAACFEQIERGGPTGWDVDAAAALNRRLLSIELLAVPR